MEEDLFQTIYQLLCMVGQDGCTVLRRKESLIIYNKEIKLTQYKPWVGKYRSIFHKQEHLIETQKEMGGIGNYGRVWTDQGLEGQENIEKNGRVGTD